jgi:hypothetical protein
VLAPPKQHQRFAVDISGLRSCPIGEALDYEAETRIVYTLDHRGRVEVLAVGRRMGSEVYKLAASRLAAEQPRKRQRR